MATRAAYKLVLFFLDFNEGKLYTTKYDLNAHLEPRVLVTLSWFFKPLGALLYLLRAFYSPLDAYLES